MIRGVASVVLAILVSGNICATEPPSEIRAPDGESSVRILDKKLPGGDPDFGDTIAIYHGDKLLSQFSTIGYLTSAFWSPSGRFVAVNNRRATYGDYFWVFRVSDGRAIKEPSDASPVAGQPIYSSETLLARVRAKFPEYRDAGYYKFGAHAERWTSRNELEVAAFIGFTHIEKDLVRIYDPYAVSDKGLRLVGTRMERTNA